MQVPGADLFGVAARRRSDPRLPESLLYSREAFEHELTTLDFLETPIEFEFFHLASPVFSRLFPSFYCYFFFAASAAAFSSARAPLRMSSIP